MGQTPNGKVTSNGEYSLVKDLPNGSIVKQNNTNELHFLKQYSFTNQESYQQAFVNFSKRLPDKHQHALYLQRTNTKLENTFCSTFYKISLLYEFLDHNLQEEIEQRQQQHRVFDQKQVWSILCSCVLGMCEIMRAEGRTHSALTPRDIRLSEEGLIKILSLEMVGMHSDHDISKESTPKDLVPTILKCYLMEEISNESPEYLDQVIENLDSTIEFKNILRLMLQQTTKYVQLEDELYKFAQEETDSLNSYSNTPNLKEKPKCENSYSKIPQQSKEDDSLMAMTRDQEDRPDGQPLEPMTNEAQTPDQNDLFDESNSKYKYQESNQNTLRENSNTPKLSIAQSRKNENKIETIEHHQQDSSLFTDPKLLNLIHTDLEEIKKRKETTNSRKLGVSESKFSLEHKQESKNIQTQFINITNTDESKENEVPFTYLKNQTQEQFKHISLHSASQPIITNITNNQQRPSFRKQSGQISRSGVSNEQVTWNSQKQITQLCSNPEKKIKQKTISNIMDIEDMGFKKNKPNNKQKQEEMSRVSHNMKNSNATSSVAYNSNDSNNAEGKMPIYTYLLDKSRQSQQSRVSKKSELEYVTETYVRGRFEGTKLNGMRHGKGVFYYNEGGKYIGEWKENKMFGKGVLYYPNNEIAYDGEWKNDQLEGKGTLYNEQYLPLSSPFDFRNWDQVEDYWIKYEGQFSEDSKNGKGKLYLSNGEILEGNFKDDMVWGEGVLNKRDGTRVKGCWKQNKLVKRY